MSKAWKKIGESDLSPVENDKRKELELKTYKKESIIIIGAENEYNSFWLKMMFIGAATCQLTKSQDEADRTTIAYVAEGYTKLELGVLENWCNKHKFNIFRLDSNNDLITLMNKDREEYKIISLIFFSHGYPGVISLNYGSEKKVNFSHETLNSCTPNIFSLDGKIFSYACRTGISNLLNRSFDNDSDAGPEKSLAQQLADYFGISVYAFLTRTFYGNILRQRTEETSRQLSENLKKSRATGGDFSVYRLSDEHEALPHPGLADGILDFGAKGEGTNGFALWRKQGGLVLPSSGETPTGLTKGLVKFTPQKERVK
ncbi:hypothetical protein Pecwa_4259 [Pectobacterium parmentieri WPP163]|uniref:hypothetical protein n=1 Tax=Pectobacterium parmentieri TaxID=1905730 RepID=UPI0001B11990|nr:hypothetical protein [Pectobacterium parmentieri]ACX89983.1 hypothetical protein Pecwa_4259 [Pectobacterium parmentieri WPP163]AYH07688.1 hypothetical protein C5E25_21180 [Pectobacterium parmentieri]AYH16441.1 hypothetical protein C5E23_20780 [Pectobacterium parmentieri]AYH25141.1 hypothetical protein C5E21_20810 [Pectobacterium parmentieri]MBN3177264.1 hypothetical protein [Pectobacterium parmentieri]